MGVQLPLPLRAAVVPVREQGSDLGHTVGDRDFRRFVGILLDAFKQLLLRLFQ
ncbi:MAG: hypothetical protein GWN58_16330 [Anaerolineae bacterium]|nr:hypothetical protein [Anaerolineae bacterium]